MSAAIFESKSQNSAKKLVRALTGDEKPGFSGNSLKNPVSESRSASRTKRRNPDGLLL